MTTQLQLTSQPLYDQDYALWLEETIAQLRQGAWTDVDVVNLIEELEGMARSDKRALKSFLTRLFEHLLKLSYWDSEREYNQRGWKGEITHFRISIQNILEDSPSRKADLEKVFEKSYQDAREVMINTTGLSPSTFPLEPIAPLDQVLDKNWFPLP